MTHFLRLTTAISLLTCTATAWASPSMGMGAGMLPASRYQTLRSHAVVPSQPVRTAAQPLALSASTPKQKVAAEPKPLLLASADVSGMALPSLSPSAPSVVDQGMTATPSLIPVVPVLPHRSTASRPLLYPSKVSYAPMPRVLPVPQQQQVQPSQQTAQAPAELLPVPQPQPDAVAADTGMQPTVAPVVLPLPESMAQDSVAPQFKPYATIETQTGTVPVHAAPHDMSTAAALKELDDVEAKVNAMVPASVPAQAQDILPMPEVVSRAQPPEREPQVAQPLDTPALLPLPEEMAKAENAQTRPAKAFARDTASNKPSSGGSLSQDTQQVLAQVPSGIDAPKTSTGGKMNVKRYSPDVEGVLGRAAKESQEASMEGDGVSIKVRRPTLNADYELERAYNALSAGESGEAIEIYQDVAAAYPRNEAALFGLAAIFHQMGETDKARSYYKRLLAINPTHRDGLNNFLVLMSEEDPQEALHQLQMLERRNPNFSPIPAQMGIIYSKMGNLDAAKSKMQQALRLAPGNLAYQYNLAIIMDKMGAYPQAASIYRGLIAASQRGEDVPAEMDEIQQRLVYIDRVHAN